MTAHDCDVLVAGAGLPGLALACALAAQGVDVAIADRAPILPPQPRGESGDEEWDARVYAISPGSQAFLAMIDVWAALPPQRLAPIEAMHVRGDRGAALTFSAYELGERALAWIVEERELRAALVERLAPAGVRTLPAAAFERLDFSPDAATLAFEGGDRVRAKLVVGADGLRSWVRAAAGIAREPRGYRQCAIVANFACERAHRGVARQWFLADGGVLAWLPLPGQRISIVWSAPEPLAEALLALDVAQFAERVASAGEHALGALRTITPPASFPLAFLRLPGTVAHRLALVGDAAHGIHPLAGQGLNLGFGDAAALAHILATRGPVRDPGTPVLLERYARRRHEPVLAVQAVTDGLARLFATRRRGLAALRNFGLGAVDRLPLLKRALAQPALR